MQMCSSHCPKRETVIDASWIKTQIQIYIASGFNRQIRQHFFLLCVYSWSSDNNYCNLNSNYLNFAQKCLWYFKDIYQKQRLCFLPQTCCWCLITLNFFSCTALFFTPVLFFFKTVLGFQLQDILFIHFNSIFLLRVRSVFLVASLWSSAAADTCWSLYWLVLAGAITWPAST